MYIEDKSDQLVGSARIGRVTFSKTERASTTGVELSRVSKEADFRQTTSGLSQATIFGSLEADEVAGPLRGPSPNCLGISDSFPADFSSAPYLSVNLRDSIPREIHGSLLRPAPRQAAASSMLPDLDGRLSGSPDAASGATN